MIPIRTTVDDLDRIVDVSSKQVGWFALARLKQLLSATGAGEDRKIATAVALKFVDRDGGNVRITELGQDYSGGDKRVALRKAIREHGVYGPTLEWISYSGLGEVTTVQIGQQWEGHHKDEVGDVGGQTLKDGATVFGRLAEGAGFGTFKVGRGGNNTRLTVDTEALSTYLKEMTAREDAESSNPSMHDDIDVEAGKTSGVSLADSAGVPPSRAPAVASPQVVVSTSPSVHVNLEIHIAADATADTVREIFRNMARYILDRPPVDHDEH